MKKQRMIATVTGCLLALCLAACGAQSESKPSTDTAETEVMEEEERADDTEASTDEAEDAMKDGGAVEETVNDANPEYSDRTLIVTVSEEMTDEQMQAICDEFHLEIVYDYDNFLMYALSTEKPMEEDDMQTLMAELMRQDGILAVERDAVVHLDDAAN